MGRRLTGPQKMARYFMVADVGEARTVLDLARVIVEAREGPKVIKRRRIIRSSREPMAISVTIPPNEPEA